MNRLLDWSLIEIVNGKLVIEIVAKKKGFKVEQLLGSQMNYIWLMDTRHYAIINMVFMGYEHATLHRIIGDKTVKQSYSYFDHGEIFTNCYILNVVTKKKHLKSIAIKKSNF